MSLPRRLSPGRSASLRAVRLQDGTISSDPADMATALKAHWSRVFAAGKIHMLTLEQWLHEDLPPDTLSSLPDRAASTWK